ncbi:MAG TPA: xanthine dehydrogenase family protein subunit M [Nitrospirota bacterium]|nr:xanthine dehydrogenase family protein subunit M [Nitrospirota bacterium]
MLTNFSYTRPASLKDAVKQLSSPDSGLHAGGTDLLGCLRDHVFEVKKVVSISGLKELRGITRMPDKGLRIGALTTITEVAENAAVNEDYAALAQAAREVGSPQLRNQGTLGGNLCQKPRCWYYRGEFHCLRKGGDRCFAVSGENQYHCILGGGPCYIVHPSDTAAALVAFNASVHIAGPKGSRSVPVEKFHLLPQEDVRRETVLKPGEIVTEIVLPAGRGLRSSYRKVRSRASWDFALAGIALAIRFDAGGAVASARAVLSGAAPIPWRSRELESVITGKKLDADIIAKAAEAALRNAQPLRENAAKIPLFQGMIEEELAKIGKG